MLEAFLNRILQIHNPNEIVTTEIGGNLYSRHGLSRIKKPEQEAPKYVQFITLAGLIEFAALEGIEDAAFFVDGPKEVMLRSKLQPENENGRFIYAAARPAFEQFQFDVYHDLESFVIDLQSLFEPSKDIENILSMLSNLHNEYVIENKDDGFTQSLNIKTGITTKGKAKVENPVTLKPFRTFAEVNQPEGQFIVRYRSDGKGIEACLTEAGGGLWKLEAIANIKKYLKANGTFPVVG